MIEHDDSFVDANPHALASAGTPSLAKLDRLSRYAADWDGEGADPPTPAAIGKSRELLGEIAHLLGLSHEPGFIAPIADGGIYLEWSTPDQDLHLEIDFDGSLHALIADRSAASEQFHKRRDISMPDALELIRKVLARRLPG